MERSYGSNKKEEAIGFIMTTKEKPYPYLKNSTIENESIKLIICLRDNYKNKVQK